MNVRVESYSGHKADERPFRFWLGEREHAVDEVLDRWYDPNASFFKVRASDGNLYILRSEVDGNWSLEAFRSTK